MNIFQILICDDDWLEWNIHNQQHVLAEKKQKMLDVFCDYDYHLYTNDKAKEFLSEFDKEVFDCFNTLNPYAFRADLLRYCLLYKFGGWYFDLSIKVVQKFTCDHDYIIFQNPKVACIENCILYSSPSTSFYSKLIQKIVSNVKDRLYGRDCLNITGPSMMKDVFNKHDKQDKKNNFLYGKLLKNDETGEFSINNNLFAI